MHDKQKDILQISLTASVLILAAVVLFTGISVNTNLVAFTIAISDAEISDSANDAGNAAPAPAPTPTPTPAPTFDMQDLMDGDPSIGDPDAPVKIVEFSDFQCPFCKRFVDQTKDLIFQEYGDAIYFEYRDFPLNSIHPSAQKAAEAAECAAEQGMFWEMHDTIFNNQSAIGVDSLKGYAADLGLDTAQFDSCLDTGKYAAEVQADLDDGQNAGVTGTPAFFINGIKVVGAQPFSVFKQIIDAELA